MIVARDPVNGGELGRVAETDPADVTATVAAARRVQPLWALLRVEDRARYLRRLAQAAIDQREQIVAEIAREQGRPAGEVAALELLPAVDALSWMAREGPRALALRRVGLPRLAMPLRRARIAFEPYGVVGVIGAGSAPLVQPLAQIAGALLAGNAVVFKPARRAALAGERIARVLARADLPEGLVQLVNGGAAVGIALAESSVDKVMFTGSPRIGRAVARACVSRDTEVTVELGGKDAMLVLSDANVDAAAACAAWAGCAAAGQARGAVERVYVDRLAYEHFVRRLVEEARALRVGDPHEPGTAVGPLSSRRRLEHVDALVREAVEQGASMLCGGVVEPARDDAQGEVAARGEERETAFSPAYYAPTVLVDVTHAMRIMREPVGGPVLAVMAVESTDEALALANDSEFSLGASVWTADHYHGLRIARELRAGMVWLNDHLPAPVLSRGPWGAFAGGGIGRTLGLAGLRACAQEKLIARDPVGVGGLWWGSDDVIAHAATVLAQLQSARRGDRERGLRASIPALARLGVRALARRERP